LHYIEYLLNVKVLYIELKKAEGKKTGGEFWLPDWIYLLEKTMPQSRHRTSPKRLSRAKAYHSTILKLRKNLMKN